MAVHTCCVPIKRGLVARDGVPETACADVSSSPVEGWHVRHLKQDEPCRRHTPRAMLEPQHKVVDVPLEYAPLPAAWAAEYTHARAQLAAQMRPLLGSDVDAYRRARTVDFHPQAWGSS